MKNIKSEVYKIIASVLDIRIADIHLNSKWEENNTDSFALVELIVAIQQHFNIKFDSSELGKLENVEDLVRAVEHKVTK